MEKSDARLTDPALIDQNRTLFRQLPIILVVNLPLIAGLGLIYWPWVNHSLLLLWGGGMLVMMLVRFIVYTAIYKKLPPDQLVAWPMKIFAVNSALSGLMWGIGGILLFVPGRLDLQLIILLVLIIKGAGSVSSVTSYLPSFYAYFPASILPICLRFFIQGDMVSVLLGLTVLVYTLVLLVFGRNLNRTLLKSLRLRHENRQLLEEALTQKAQAEQANNAKSRFLAAASHDLRQPIYALGLFNAVLEEIETHPKSARIVEQIGSTITTLQNLLDALLDISKLDAGVIEVNRRHVDLQPLLARLANDFAPQAVEKGIQLRWPHASVAVYSDEALLEQVLRNLISNALRYTRQGTVTINAVMHDEQVKIEVCDTGIGIAPEQQHEIFAEFYQVGNPERDRRQGLGLGLAIVDRVLRLIGSQIQLESVIGQGSRFYFNVPQGDPLRLVRKPAPATAKSEHTLRATIAVVEDDKDVADAMGQLLHRWGCTTFISADANGMLEQLRQSNVIPDLIISDLQLANDQNGIEAITRIRALAGKSIPALIITGSNHAAQLEEVRGHGIPLLHKPVAPARLRSWLRHTLQSAAITSTSASEAKPSTPIPTD